MRIALGSFSLLRLHRSGSETAPNLLRFVLKDLIHYLSTELTD